MKAIFLNQYNRVAIAFWLFIFLMLWQELLLHASFYQSLLQISLIFADLTLFAYILSNRILPKSMENKAMKRFSMIFIVFTLIQALILGLIFKLFYNLEIAEVFPRSEIVYDDAHFFRESFSFIPSAILVNTAFCGFRFYYELSILEKVHLETQLQVLKQQISPHFMFNVLNHIYILMQENTELASSLLLKYSDILRFQLYKGEQEYILLEHDVQFLKDFIDIETIRWIDKVDVRSYWKIEDARVKIPPLLFITLIENAFKHVSRTNIEKGYITINFEQIANSITLSVQNSKSIYRGAKKADSGLGLQNLKKRLNLLFAKKHSLEIKETKDTYLSKLIIQIKEDE